MMSMEELKMKTRKPKKRFSRKIVTTEHLALRELRLDLNLSLKEAGVRLGVSSKMIGAIENGRVTLNQEWIERVVFSYGLTLIDFKRAKRILEKEGPKKRRQRVVTRTVLKNSDRRSYQKIITKECRVLRSLRRQKGLSQDQASAQCGYSRPSIGHIENGRIELTTARIVHILKCYQIPFHEFENCLKKDVQKDELADQCMRKIQLIGDDKLNLIKGILDSF
jgi:transcriptional regulator with XRE-family HTH domain